MPTAAVLLGNFRDVKARIGASQAEESAIWRIPVAGSE